MKAITTCVGYDDFLAITLPANARHFDKIVVVSTPQDDGTAAVVAKIPNAELYTTSAFYRDGASFRKGLAIEEGFDVLGRDGWICVLDADTMLPPEVDFSELLPGFLYSPRRRLLRDPAAWSPGLDWPSLPMVDDEEFAGYCQIFYATDPALAARPWYSTDWKHAGGCDSEFQARWPLRRKLRLPFEVLHLGEDCRNWCGRVTKRLDGRPLPPDTIARARQMQAFLAERDRSGNFNHEKV